VTLEGRSTRACGATDSNVTMEASPARLPEMLSDRFGALQSVGLLLNQASRYVSACEMSMDLLFAKAVLEFGDDLREACKAAMTE